MGDQLGTSVELLKSSLLPLSALCLVFDEQSLYVGWLAHCLVGPKQYPTKEDSTTQYKIVPHSTKYYDAMLHNVFYKLAQSCRKQKRISDYSVCYWGTLNYYCAIEVHCAIGVNCAIGPHCAIGVHCGIGPHAK